MKACGIIWWAECLLVAVAAVPTNVLVEERDATLGAGSVLGGESMQRTRWDTFLANRDPRSIRSLQSEERSLGIESPLSRRSPDTAPNPRNRPSFFNVPGVNIRVNVFEFAPPLPLPQADIHSCLEEALTIFGQMIERSSEWTLPPVLETEWGAVNFVIEKMQPARTSHGITGMEAFKVIGSLDYFISTFEVFEGAIFEVVYADSDILAAMIEIRDAVSSNVAVHTTPTQVPLNASSIASITQGNATIPLNDLRRRQNNPANRPTAIPIAGTDLSLRFIRTGFAQPLDVADIHGCLDQAFNLFARMMETMSPRRMIPPGITLQSGSVEFKLIRWRSEQRMRSINLNEASRVIGAMPNFIDERELWEELDFEIFIEQDVVLATANLMLYMGDAANALRGNASQVGGGIGQSVGSGNLTAKAR